MKLLVALSVLVAAVQTQVVFEKDVLRQKYASLFQQHPRLALNYPTYALPPYIDNTQLASQAAALDAQLKNGPLRFGEAFEVDLDIKDGAWSTLPGPDQDRIWRLALRSETAFSLNLLFSDFELPVGGELYVIAEEEGSVTGPYSYRNNKQSRKFATTPVRGNKILLEYYAPKDAFLPTITISKIVHGFKPTPFTHPESSGSCNINVICQEGDEWRDQIRSVVMMLSGAGTGYCSGSMLNNVNQDGRQLFLTANHCTGRDVSYDMVMFDYQAAKCIDRTAKRSKKTAQGLKTLSKYYNSDFAIFEVEERIPDEWNVFLSGWSALPLPFVPENPVGIHHPSADIKKISFAFLNASQTCWAGKCGRRSPDHWQIDSWSKGTTEPGSSGSPLFDGTTKRVVGQLHGGTASCWNSDGWDAYGKLTTSFDAGSSQDNTLGSVLDPESTGTRALDGIELADARKSFRSSRFVFEV